jgi:hypothetical protein
VRTIQWLWLWLWLWLWTAAACTPSAGSSCEKGEARCIDGTRQLACQNGKFVETPCRGPGGCALGPEGTSCDFSKNRPGDACSSDDEGAALCAGPKQMIACRGGQYRLVSCHGPKGCTGESGYALCDQSVAELGDACKDDGKKACAADGKSVLVCRADKMERLFWCRGERGCSSAGGKLDCDLSLAIVGDPCDPTMEGSVSCSEDGSSTLVCKARQFAHDQACAPKTRCVAQGTTTRCEKL